MSAAEPVPEDETPGMHIWGWMQPVELRWLMQQAAKMDSVVEVGSLHGRSAFALLTACPGPVTCIDPWDDRDGRSYVSFIGACGHFPNLRTIKKRSPGAAALVEDADMVFLDGDHDYDAVLADIDAWLPKARRLLCGHDFFEPAEHAGFPGVPRAVRERFGDLVQVGPETSIWYVELPL